MGHYNEFLDRKREERGLSCGELAEKAGVGMGTLSRCINGRTRTQPLQRTVAKLCRALDCSPADIGFSDGEVS